MKTSFPIKWSESVIDLGLKFLNVKSFLSCIVWGDKGPDEGNPKKIEEDYASFHIFEDYIRESGKLVKEYNTYLLAYFPNESDGEGFEQHFIIDGKLIIISGDNNQGIRLYTFNKQDIEFFTKLYLQKRR